MATEDYKLLINSGIIGGNAGVFGERMFVSLETNKLERPMYNARFFETFPTIWASAYAFGRSLEEKDQSAVGEWISLFALQFFGILGLNRYPEDTITSKYDQDLWPALSGTYPKDAKLREIKLLKADDGTIVGAYYPDMVFFPSRGRAGWASSERLKPYLEGTTLSWSRCKSNFLLDEETRKKFYKRMRSIFEYVLVGGPLRDALQDFCKDRPEFKSELPEDLEVISRDPVDWLTLAAAVTTPQLLIEKYPLKREKASGGYTYYLVTDMPDRPGSEWMRSAIEPGLPTPMQYEATGNKEVTVRSAGSVIKCLLEEGDSIILLKNLFLSDSGTLCGIPRGNESYARFIKPLHKIEVRESSGLFDQLRVGDTAVCLAPIQNEFLEHFPEFLSEPETKITAERNRDADTVDWTFTLKDNLRIGWSSLPSCAKALPNSALSIWPPNQSKGWRLYVAHGTGAKKEESGRWVLIDEKGTLAKNVELDDEEYVSILQDSERPNRPRALMLNQMLNHTRERQRGILFLSTYGNDVQPMETASMSMDFGTSNSCLAYKPEGRMVKLLSFKSSPVMIWGAAPALENVGFVPSSWNAGKFYPSILLSRKKADYLSQIEPRMLRLEDLFQVDIPGLHSGVEERLYTGGLNSLWNIHDNLKWELGTKQPWRSLFLGLSLLYAHAEVFFSETDGAKINRYVLTYPLALPFEERKVFHEGAQEIIVKLRRYCYGSAEANTFTYDSEVNESTAIAVDIILPGIESVIDLFVDVGGGTADIAVRHNREFKVLDSVRVAGRTFFQFAEYNFKRREEVFGDICGAPIFRKHLGHLLLNQDDTELPVDGLKVNLGTFYSLKINNLDDPTFTDRERTIVNRRMGQRSFQKYRTLLFFRHIIAYSLLQTCAAVVDEKIMLHNGIRIVFGGNAWSLMLFAEFRRNAAKFKSEAESILQTLKQRVLELVDEEEKSYVEALKVFSIELLNEKELSRAKTAVATGALKAGGPSREKTSPYTGITLKGLRVNDFEPTVFRWCERWGDEHLKNKLKLNIDFIESFVFEKPSHFHSPMDPLLGIFTLLGNSRRPNVDPLPVELWAKVNGMLCEDRAYLDEQRMLGQSPINYFLSKVLYPEDDEHFFLNEMAKINNNFTI